MFFISNTTADNTFKKEFAKILAFSAFLNILNRIKERKIEGKTYPYKLYLLEEEQIPFWKFSFEKKHHVIAIPKVDANKKENLVDTLHSFLHESSHALYSPYDFKKINQKLEKESIPFDFINIMEDIYIEQRFKKEFTNNKVPMFAFAELKYKTSIKNIQKYIIKKDDTPFNVLIKILSLSGEYTNEAYSNPYFLPIKSWIDDILNEHNPEKRVELMIDMYKDIFKNNSLNNNQKITQPQQEQDSETEEENNNNNKIKENRIKDLTETVDKDLNTLLNNAEEVDEDEIISYLSCENNQKHSIEFESEKISFFQKETFGDETFIDLNTPLINNFNISPESINAIKSIKKEIEKYIKPVYKIKKIKKFSGNSFDINNLTKFISKTDINAPFIKEKIPILKEFPSYLLYLDISGSMNGKPLESIKILLTALNEIVYKNPGTKISVILMGDGKYQGIHLPIPVQKIWEINSNGGTSNHDIIIERTQELRKKYDFSIYCSDLYVDNKELSAIKKINSKNNNLIIFYIDYDEKIIKETYQKALEITKDKNKIFINTNIEKGVKDFIHSINKYVKIKPNKKCKIKNVKDNLFKI